MASMLKVLGLSLWLYLASHGSTTVVSQSPAVVNGTVLIDQEKIIGRTDDDFICATMDWWPSTKCDYGTCSWGNASLLNLDLSNKIFLNAIKAFSPLKIRLGGTLQDKLRYQTSHDDDSKPCTQFVRNETEMFEFTEGCLPLSRWDELNRFFKLSGAKIIFGLNALAGRTLESNHTATGTWDSSNAESFINYTVGKGFIIYGWELGNELSGQGIGTSIAADTYAKDVKALAELVRSIYKGNKTKPLVIGPGGFFDATWFTNFISLTNSSLQVVTHHIYNLGAGVDTHLVEKILDPNYLDREAHDFSNLQNILKIQRSSTIAWVGEAGGAYNSGHNNVTNAFVFSFWYLDQLGMSASYDTKTYCRQTLIGGNYGLLDTNTFVPNPDYYSALLWHRLMGRNVLSTSFNGTNMTRAYAHCSKNSDGITLLLINLDNSTKVQVGLSIGNAISNKTLTLEQIVRQTKNTTVKNMERDEYLLTADGGDLHSRTMLLNGEKIIVNPSGMISALQPKRVHASEPITITPLSILFVKMPYIQVPACPPARK